MESEVTISEEVVSNFFKSVGLVLKSQQNVHLGNVLGSGEFSVRNGVSEVG